MFYGQVTDNEESLAALQAPVLGFFGSEDSTIPIATVLEFDTALENLNKEYTIEIFEGAKGGFASASNRNFDLALSDESWETMIDFLLLQFATSSVDSE